MMELLIKYHSFLVQKNMALCKNEWVNLLLFRYRICFCNVAAGEQSEPVDYSVGLCFVMFIIHNLATLACGYICFYDVAAGEQGEPVAVYRLSTRFYTEPLKSTPN